MNDRKDLFSTEISSKNYLYCLVEYFPKKLTKIVQWFGHHMGANGQCGLDWGLVIPVIIVLVIVGNSSYFLIFIVKKFRRLLR